MAYGNVDVLTTATLIVSANCQRKNLSIVNNGAKSVFLGSDSSVTVSTGFPLFQFSTRDQSKIPEGYLGDIYGIVTTGTADVRYWETIV